MHPVSNEKAPTEPRNLYVLHAVVGCGSIWDHESAPVDPHDLPLSERLLVAIEDWRDFYDEIAGDLSDLDLDEFVGQGFKIAHRMRSELKGRDVSYRHPATGEVIAIESRR